MVMKKNAMRKNLQQSIVKSIGRYLAIVMIIALGAAMFVGLLMTKSDMVATGQKYMEEQNMFDLRLISPYGWDKEHVDKVAQLDGVVDAEGVLYLDAVADHENQAGAVYRFYEIPEKLMDAGSAVAGCGPAFACLFAEALADGGVACGLPRDKALTYAAQMLLGTAKLILESGEHPGKLKDAVCSPGGSTIAGVRALEQGNFRGSTMDAVESAYYRTKELGK